MAPPFSLKPFSSNLPPVSKRILNPELIVKTVAQLRDRIAERFPESGLAGVCADLTETARATAARVENLARPNIALRFLAVAVVAAGIAAQVYVAHLIDWAGVLIRSDRPHPGPRRGGQSPHPRLRRHLVRAHARAAAEAPRGAEAPLRAARLRPRHRHASAYQGPDRAARRTRAHLVLAGAAHERVPAFALSRLLLGDAGADRQARLALCRTQPRPRGDHGGGRGRGADLEPGAQDLAEDHDPQPARRAQTVPMRTVRAALAAALLLAA